MSHKLGIWEAAADLNTTLKGQNKDAKDRQILTITSNLRIHVKVKDKLLELHMTKALARFPVMKTIEKQKTYKGIDVTIALYDTIKAFEEAAK